MFGRCQPLIWDGTPRGWRFLPGRCYFGRAVALPGTKERVTTRAALVFIESPVFCGCLVVWAGDGRAGDHGRDVGRHFVVLNVVCTCGAGLVAGLLSPGSFASRIEWAE